jgi:hypothetical protein
MIIIIMRTFSFASKIHTIPILLHQISISTTFVSSMILRRKKLEIRNVGTVKTRWKNQTDCCEMELNPSKDISSYMHEGDNPPFTFFQFFFLTVNFILIYIRIFKQVPKIILVEDQIILSFIFKKTLIIIFYE